MNRVTLKQMLGNDEEKFSVKLFYSKYAKNNKRE